MANSTKREKTTYSDHREDLFGGRSELRVSPHALREAHKEGLRGKDIIHAVLTGTVVERYPARRRVLISSLFPNSSMPIHVVCDYNDLFVVVVITVYIPNRIRWAHPLKRRTSVSI
jgi:hypothetical protein